jgi:hypothetical protein
VARGEKDHKRIAECQLVMSPMKPKSVHELLTEKQREHEAYFGEIQTSEKFDERGRKYLQSKGPDYLEFSVIFLI